MLERCKRGQQGKEQPPGKRSEQELGNSRLGIQRKVVPILSIHNQLGIADTQRVTDFEEKRFELKMPSKLVCTLLNWLDNKTVDATCAVFWPAGVKFWLRDCCSASHKRRGRQSDEEMEERRGEEGRRRDETEERKEEVSEVLDEPSPLRSLAFPMFVASELSEIWLLLLTLSLLSLLLLLLLLLSMLAMTLETAVAETTAKVRKPVTEKTLSCFSMQVGAGVTTYVSTKSYFAFDRGLPTLYLCFVLFLLPRKPVREIWRMERSKSR